MTAEDLRNAIRLNTITRQEIVNFMYLLRRTSLWSTDRDIWRNVVACMERGDLYESFNYEAAKYLASKYAKRLAAMDIDSTTFTESDRKQKEERVFASSMYKLHLSDWMLSTLCKNGFKTVGDVARGRGRIISIKGIGYKRLDTIRQAMYRVGVDFIK
jgi:hypothetical protein